MLKNNLKLNVLKKIVGRKMVIIKDHIKKSYYYGMIESVVDEYNVNARSPLGEIEKISIFDLRSPSNEYQ
jgi:hypothetical protein